MKLASGEEIVADAAYVRESILTPAAKVVAGYQPVMPAFQGQVNEDRFSRSSRTSNRCGRPTPSAPACPPPRERKPGEPPTR